MSTFINNIANLFIDDISPLEESMITAINDNRIKRPHDLQELWLVLIVEKSKSYKEILDNNINITWHHITSITRNKTSRIEVSWSKKRNPQ